MAAHTRAATKTRPGAPPRDARRRTAPFDLALALALRLGTAGASPVPGACRQAREGGILSVWGSGARGFSRPPPPPRSQAKRARQPQGDRRQAKARRHRSPARYRRRVAARAVTAPSRSPSSTAPSARRPKASSMAVSGWPAIGTGRRGRLGWTRGERPAVRRNLARRSAPATSRTASRRPRDREHGNTDRNSCDPAKHAVTGVGGGGGRRRRNPLPAVPHAERVMD